MSDYTLEQLAKRMAKLDFATLTTRGADGALSARPMSNNGDVGIRGTSVFFAYDSSRKIADIRADPHVSLGYAGAVGMLGGPPLFVTVEGRATLVQDRTRFAEHWTRELDRWFADGPDTHGCIMIEVRADRFRYWDGSDEGELTS